MFTIDFTKPFLYKDVIYFNQGNLAANNILRCKLATGGDESLEGYIATVTFKTLSHAEINESVNIVDAKNCIVDIKFPSNALEVGVNELEVILSKGEGADKVVTPSPIIKYEVWQCITTGNGIQGDTNYPILIDLMSEVNNAVRIANNASATADASLKQTAKMLEVVNTNIAKANIAIDNTNSAKDEALNAVLEVNTAKDNLISEVNTTKNTVVADVNSTKESIINDISTTKQNMITDIDKSKEAMITDTNKAINKMNKDFEALTASQQQDMEVIKARGKYDSLSQRFENLDKDLLRAKELAVTTVTTESNFAAIEETTNGYVEDIKLEGKTLVVNFKNEEVPQGTEGATLKSVGDGVDEIVVSSCNENLFDGNILQGAVLSNGDIIDDKSSLRTDYIKCKGLTDISLNYDLTGNINDNLPAFFDANKNFISMGIGNKEKTYKIPNNAYYVIFRWYRGQDILVDELSNVIINKGKQPKFYTPYKSDKKKILYYDTETQTWKKPILREWDSIEKHSDGKYYYHKRSEKRTYQEGDKSNLNVITDETNTVYKLEKEKVYECTPIDLITFENETNYLIESGAISPKSNLKCVSFIGNVINTLKEKVSYLEDKLYKTNLANFTVALNTLDTKLKLEQLTKTPR